MANLFGYRIDNHGDNVRPDTIQNARAKFRAKEISADELRDIEDDAIRAFITYQRHLTLSCLSDGGFRNGDYRSPVLQSIAGFERVPDQMLPDRTGRWTVTGPLKQRKPLALDGARFLLENTALPVKVKLPSAAHIAAQTYSDDAVRAYPGAAALGDAIAEILRDEIELLFEIGVKFVQLDNPDYSAYLVGRDDSELSFEEAREIDNAVVAGLDRDEDQKVALTIGWGDNLDGTVDVARAEKLFASDFDKFVFPYHSDAAVAQNLPLLVPNEKQIGLGIVDADDPALEDIDTVMPRLDLAIEQHDYDRIAFLPNHGFQRVHYHPAKLTIEEQRRKLEHVETFATMIWGNEA
jgi:5-methyltetrahydropteroyltriglutamate--homocysteine methyltransferase